MLFKRIARCSLFFITLRNDSFIWQAELTQFTLLIQRIQISDISYRRHGIMRPEILKGISTLPRMSRFSKATISLNSTGAGM